MSTSKSSFVKGRDPLTALDLGNIRIAKEWLDLHQISFDEKSVKRSRGDSGQAIIELAVDSDIDATLVKRNPDWKSGRTGTAKIVFQFEN